jgi:hypothetical protein
MSILFICPGVCTGCPAKECPERGSMGSLKNLLKKLHCFEEKLAEKLITPESTIEIMSGSLFNGIQSLEIRMDMDEDISQKMVEEMIKSLLPFNINNVDSSEKATSVLLSVIKLIADKIFLAIQNKCSEHGAGCRLCYLHEYCPQLKNSASKKPGT